MPRRICLSTGGGRGIGVAYHRVARREGDLTAVVHLAPPKHGRIDPALNRSGQSPDGDLPAITDANWHLHHRMILNSGIRTTCLAPGFSDRGDVAKSFDAAALKRTGVGASNRESGRGWAAGLSTIVCQRKRSPGWSATSRVTGI